MVDERDFWILSQLRKDPFLSYETLGKGIGLSGKAVKTRIEALEKARILALLQAMPAAQVFDRLPRLLFFKEPAASLDKFYSAMKIDPVVFSTLDVDRRIAILVYELSGSRKHPEELTTLLGPIDSEVTPLFPHPQRELSKPLTQAELKVLRMLVSNLRVSIKEISQKTGLSQKTAKKTRRQLLDDGLFQIQPIIQSAQSSRILMFELHVHSSDKEVLARVNENLPKSVFLNQWEPTAIVLSCWANSISEVFETERNLKNEPGVNNVLVKFHTQAILSTSRLISWIDKEIVRFEKGKHCV